MIKINLIPRDILDKEQQKQYTTQASMAGVLILVIWGFVSFLHWHKATKLEANVIVQKQKLEKLQQIVATVQALEQTASAVKTRLSVITDLLKGRPLYPYFMVDFAQTLPSGVWITSLNTRGQGSNQLSITAQSNSITTEAIADWMRNIVKTGRFSDPNLSSISISGVEGAKVHNFNITTTYKHPNL